MIIVVLDVTGPMTLKYIGSYYLCYLGIILIIYSVVSQIYMITIIIYFNITTQQQASNTEERKQTINTTNKYDIISSSSIMVYTRIIIITFAGIKNAGKQHNMSYHSKCRFCYVLWLQYYHSRYIGLVDDWQMSAKLEMSTRLKCVPTRTICPRITSNIQDIADNFLQ